MTALDPRAVLRRPEAYNLFQSTVGAARLRSVLASEFIRARPGDRVLDLGCGTACIRPHLGDVDYVGIDADAAYLAWARRRYSGDFIQRPVGQALTDGLPRGFDVVLAVGLLHHLDDGEAVSLFSSARDVLKPGGRMVTADACYDDRQSPVARLMVSRDRGGHVRPAERYAALARSVFGTASASVRHDLLRIPYTHAVLRCERP